MSRVVLDTNVVVSALLKKNSNPDLCLNVILSGLVKIILSHAIVTEYEEVLLRPEFDFNQKLVKVVLHRLTKNAILTKVTQYVDASADPEDNRFIEASISGKADYIVAGNKHHFPMHLNLVSVVSPAEFIESLAREIGTEL